MKTLRARRNEILLPKRSFTDRKLKGRSFPGRGKQVGRPVSWSFF